jgi:hypothetical protein
MDYYSKYLKYKTKYLELQKTRKSMKSLTGGTKSLTGGTKSLTGGMLKEKLTYDEVMAILNKDKYLRLPKLPEYIDINKDIQDALSTNIEAYEHRNTSLMSYIHIYGTFSDHDIITSAEISDQYNKLFPAIKLYCNFIHQDDKTEMIKERCLNLLGLDELTHEMVKLSYLDFKRATLISILSREFLKNLYDETDDIKKNGLSFNLDYIKTEKKNILDDLNKKNMENDKIRNMYLNYDDVLADFIIVNKSLIERQKKFKAEYNKIMASATNDLIGNKQYPEFNNWVQLKKHNLCQILTDGQIVPFNEIFLHPTKKDGLIIKQFNEMAKQIWCFKLLCEALTYKERTTMFFPSFGEDFDTKYIDKDNYFQVIDESSGVRKTIYCTFMPIIKIDSSILKAYALINYNDTEKQIKHDPRYDLPENINALKLLIQKENDEVKYMSKHPEIGDYWDFLEKRRTQSVNLYPIIKPSLINDQDNIHGPSFDAGPSQIKRQSSQIDIDSHFNPINVRLDNSPSQSLPSPKPTQSSKPPQNTIFYDPDVYDLSNIGTY